MSNSIQIKRSSVANKVPTTEQLEFGEFAVNIADGKLYMKFDHGFGPVIEEVGVGSLLITVAQMQQQLTTLQNNFDAYVETHP